MCVLISSAFQVVFHSVVQTAIVAYAAQWPDEVAKLAMLDVPVPGTHVWDEAIHKPDPELAFRPSPAAGYRRDAGGRPRVRLHFRFLQEATGRTDRRRRLPGLRACLRRSRRPPRRFRTLSGPFRRTSNTSGNS